MWSFANEITIPIHIFPSFVWQVLRILKVCFKTLLGGHACAILGDFCCHNSRHKVVSFAGGFYSPDDRIKDIFPGLSLIHRQFPFICTSLKTTCSETPGLRITDSSHRKNSNKYTFTHS